MFNRAIDMMIVLVLFMLAGCATTPLQEKRKEAIECLKQLKMYEYGDSRAIEACLKVYNLEHKQEVEKESGI